MSLWPEIDKEKKQLIELHGSKVDKSGEAYQLLRAEFLRRWDSGVPVGMMPGSTGTLAYIVACCFNDLLKRGNPTIASQATFRQTLGAAVPLQDKTIDASEAIRLLIIRNGFHELAMHSAFGWEREDQGRGAERRWSGVYDAWMKSDDLNIVIIDDLWSALDSYAFDTKLIDIISLKPKPDGFYGNKEFPITPPTAYDLTDVETTTVKLDEQKTLVFRWVLNPSDDDEELNVYDWNVHLKDIQSKETKAYVGGTAYTSKNGSKFISARSMDEAADYFTETYHPAISALASESVGLRIKAPVAIVHYWERQKEAPKGDGAQCLEAALRFCAGKLGASWTCFVHVKPMQFSVITPVAGVSQAMVLHLQAAELAIMSALNKIRATSTKLPSGVELIWQKTPNHTIRQD